MGCNHHFRLVSQSRFIKTAWLQRGVSSSCRGPVRRLWASGWGWLTYTCWSRSGVKACLTWRARVLLQAAKQLLWVVYHLLRTAIRFDPPPIILRKLLELILAFLWVFFLCSAELRLCVSVLEWYRSGVTDSGGWGKGKYWPPEHLIYTFKCPLWRI